MIFFEYTSWFVLLVVLFASLLVWFAYKNFPIVTNKKNNSIINYLAATCRWFGLVSLGILLIGLIFKQTQLQKQKPVLVFAIDNSASIKTNEDVAKIKTALDLFEEKTKAQLGNEFEWVRISFGNRTEKKDSLNFNEKSSNLSEVFDWSIKNYPAQNIGAIVMVSDGIYNGGENPIYASTQNLAAPIFTIGLGDTTHYPDISIAAVRHNKTVLKNNNYQIEIDIKGKNVPAVGATLVVWQNGVKFKSIPLNGNQVQFSTHVIELTAKNLKSEQVKVEVLCAIKEKNLNNNLWEGFITVKDKAQKIGIVGYAPHPDLGVLKNLLQTEQQKQVEVFLTTQNPMPNLGLFDALVFHQLPGPNGEGLALIQQAKNLRLPILYIIGAQTNLTYLNQVEQGFKSTFSPNAINDAQPLFANTFTGFKIDQSQIEALQEYPPLAAPFGTYKLNGDGEIILYQQIGFVKTEYPLFFWAGQTPRIAVIGGEGIWKWKLFEAKTNKEGLTKILLDGMVQFLLNQPSTDKLQLVHPAQFEEDDNVVLYAELLNATNQLTNQHEVFLELTNTKNKQFKYIFDRADNKYKLTISNLEPGLYRYDARTKLGNITYSKSGNFVVKKIWAEQLETTANHQLLKELATQTGGVFLNLNQPDELVKSIKNNQQIKPIIYSNLTLTQLIDLKWIFILMLLFFTTEWVIRKWYGIT